MKENISEKDQFFSKVSHDLRGNFTSILGFSDIINDPSEVLSPEELDEFVRRIGTQSRDTYDLLVNFVNWLKLEHFAYGLTNEKIELLDALYEVKSFHHKRLLEKNIEIDFHISESDYVFMDYEILNSILNNLFVFLIKICLPNSTIKITSENLLSNNKTIIIRAISSNQDSSFLQNIDLKDLNNEISFPLIFAIKFTELCGGLFTFNFSETKDLAIEINLPVKE
jgi:K+-sensing histidine kinase KdpD